HLPRTRGRGGSVGVGGGAGGFVAGEELGDGVEGGGAAHGADGFGEGDVLGADLDAVLGVAAVGDAAGAHEGFEAFICEAFAGLVEVEEAGLADGGSADEGRVPGGGV